MKERERERVENREGGAGEKRISHAANRLLRYQYLNAYARIRICRS
jgi:hypothetical protein